MWFKLIIFSYFSQLFERQERLFCNCLFSIQARSLLFCILDNFHESLRFLWYAFYWFPQILWFKILFYLRIHQVFALIGTSTGLLLYFHFGFFTNSIFFLKFHGSNCLLPGDFFVKLFPFTALTGQVFVANFGFVYLFLSKYFHDSASPFRIFYFSLLTSLKLFSAL